MPASSAGSQAGRDSSTPGSSQSTAGATANGSSGARDPGQDAGAQSRLPGDQQGAAGSRDAASGSINSGANGSSGSVLGSPSGDYSLDTLPDGVLSGRNNSQASGGAMTTAERAAVLDEELQRGYETFDGFILGERERAQAESNAAGSVAIGGDEGVGGGGSAAGQPQTLPESGQRPSGVIVASMPAAQGPPPESFPPPEDIPSGRDDDVVARQLREAAMSEPDPELREALWEEYRKYTGLSEAN